MQTNVMIDDEGIKKQRFLREAVISSAHDAVG
jgi:hypothetical protein